MKKYNVGIIGCTGMVGQRFATLLENHPWFNVTALAASSRSAGKTYKSVVEKRWAMKTPIPTSMADMIILDAVADMDEVVSKVDFVFCAVDMKKDEIRALEEKYAKKECPVVSNNSANRRTEDVPMVVPEINADHIRAHRRSSASAWAPSGALWPSSPTAPCSATSRPSIPLLESRSGTKALGCPPIRPSPAPARPLRRWPEMVDNCHAVYRRRGREEPSRSR